MIKLLDKATIDKIAAGEVIERPFSVVKELLDNSIDADASAITVEIKDGGISFIRVTDNGIGIPRDEVRTAYLRHATSKIETAEDISGVMTLGFRGEALSTIAAVSQTEMITKTSESLVGVKYVIHGGEEIAFTDVGVPDGTTIVVRNLFYNTPARKKFLKTAMTEGSYISDLVQKIALSHPDVSIKLIVNNQTKIDTSGNGNIKDTIYQLFGRDITNNLIPINHEDDAIKISGFIGKPGINRGNRGLENYFINARYIKNGIINRAIEEGYKTFTMQRQFPFTVLYITLSPDKCDVNVHPTKMEFKYSNERELFEVITKTIKDALTHKEIIPKVISEETNQEVPKKERAAEPFETVRREGLQHVTKQALAGYAAGKAKSNTASAENAIAEKKQATPAVNRAAGSYSPTYKILETLKEQSEKEYNKTEDNAAINLVKDSDVIYEASSKKKQTDGQTSLFDDDFLTEKARKKHRLIGQVFGTYWLIQYENNLYIMDQHAAHEKVKYEELIKNMDLNNVMSQNLMPPMIVTVSYVERQAILNNYDLFMKIGYDIEEFGGNEFKINAVPSSLYDIHGREMFMSFVSSLIDNAGYMSNEVFIKKISTMACKAAIKGNTRISEAEADALIDKLLSLDNPYTCPHGRPTIISMSESELEKKFKRQV